MKIRFYLIYTLLLSVFGFVDYTTSQNNPNIILPDNSRIEFPQLIAYEAEVKKALSLTPPILNLLPLDERGSKVVQAALADSKFISETKDKTTGAPFRNEIFAVRPIRAGDLPANDPSCEGRRCWVVEMFMFTHNFTSTAVVDSLDFKVLSVRQFSNFQPEIPKHLEELAVSIAMHSPEVQKQVGATKPESKDFVMAGTKTALNKTRCERSRHLCVSPTFVMGNKALWSIVDLEAGRVVGTRYTDWRENAPSAYTEQRIGDEYFLAELCQKTQTLQRSGWKFSYHLTSSDGLELLNATFNGKPRVQSTKNVDWHVSYSDKDGFGYSDAVGCPLFSSAAVVPATLPKFKELLNKENQIIGSEFHTDFLSKLWPLPCNYYYEQRFQFFNDGTFRIATASVGRGCGETGVYRPVMRITLPIGKGKVFSWDGSTWLEWKNENWVLQSADTKYSPEGYQFKFLGSNGQGFYLAPGRGQFDDKGKGDNAYTYIVKDHPELDEGSQDIPTIGPCCNSDHFQGPEKFINTPPESIEDEPVVIWYVPQLKNNGKKGEEYCWGDTQIVDGKVVKNEYPCIAGPLFVPFNE